MKQLREWLANRAENVGNAFWSLARRLRVYESALGDTVGWNFERWAIASIVAAIAAATLLLTLHATVTACIAVALLVAGGYCWVRATEKLHH